MRLSSWDSTRGAKEIHEDTNKAGCQKASTKVEVERAAWSQDGH
jgi:hypothetical protein